MLHAHRLGAMSRKGGMMPMPSMSSGMTARKEALMWYASASAQWVLLQAQQLPSLQRCYCNPFGVLLSIVLGVQCLVCVDSLVVCGLLS